MSTKTTFSRVQGLRESNSAVVARRSGSSVTGNFASAVASRPRMKKGSVASQVISYLRTRKRPSQLGDIVTYVSERRNYSNTNSANRSVSRVLAQLANWNLVTTSGTRPTQFTFNRSIVN